MTNFYNMLVKNLIAIESVHDLPMLAGKDLFFGFLIQTNRSLVLHSFYALEYNLSIKYLQRFSTASVLPKSFSLFSSVGLTENQPASRKFHDI